MFRMCIITVTALKQMIPLFSVDLSSFVPSLNQSNFSEISPAAWESQGLQYLLRCTLCWWREPCCCLSFRKLDIPDMSSSSDDSLCTFYKTLTHSLRLSHRCSLSWLTCLWWPGDNGGGETWHQEREGTPGHPLRLGGVTQLPGTLGLVQKCSD